jgi:hypothetical protein
MVPTLDLPEDPVFLLFFFEEAPQVESHRKEVYRKKTVVETGLAPSPSR